MVYIYYHGSFIVSWFIYSDCADRVVDGGHRRAALPLKKPQRLRRVLRRLRIRPQGAHAGPSSAIAGILVIITNMPPSVIITNMPGLFVGDRRHISYYNTYAAISYNN